MDHVSTWLQAAALPERFDVCGVVCAPLSVWHVHVLTQSGSPYLTGAPCDRNAAAALLLWASRNHRHGARLMYRPHALARAARHTAKRVMAVRDWLAADAACMDYVTSSLRTPGHKSPARKPGKPSSFRAVAAPLPWVLVSFLARGNPAAIEAAWDTPFAVARCLFDAWRDTTGDDDTLETLDEERRYDAAGAAR